MDNPPPSNSQAGGFIIAIGAIIGAFGGAFFGESTRGFFAGTAAGIGIALIIWLIDRRR